MNLDNLFTTSVMIALFFTISFIPAQAVQITESDVHDHLQMVAFKSPLAQFMDNIPLNEISCPQGLELIMKKTNGVPACVKPSTVQILIERGWGLHVLPDYQNEKNNSESFEISTGPYAVKTEMVNYFENYTGFLAVPDTDEDKNFPGIIMIHEWWGLNDNIEQMAEELASHGYVVLAVNLFGKEAATTADEARQLVSSYDSQAGIANMNGAIEYLKTNYGVVKMGSIGWCFGGGQSFNLALNNKDMDATVIYYGSVTADKEKLASISWPILGIFAGLDQGIPVELVKEFEKSLDDLGIQNEIHIYPNVDHAFANPSGERYAPEETKDAWEKTVAFLSETLKQ